MRRTYLVRALLVALVIGLTLAPRSGHAATPTRTCTVTDLGTLPGGSDSQATAINDVGQVVGSSSTISGTPHAARWYRGTIHDLGTLPGGLGSQATAINDVGQMVGFSDSGSSSGAFYAVLWDKAGIHNLGTLPGGSTSTATGINDWGQVVGTADDISGTQHAVLWDKGTIHDLGTLPGESLSQVTAINNWGEVAGDAVLTSGTEPLHAVVWDKGRIYDLGNALFSSQATALNNWGEVVGVTGHPFFTGIVGIGTLWIRGQALPLLPLAGDTISTAFSINNRGQILGASGVFNVNGGGTGHTVLWDKSGVTLLNLAPLAPLPGDAEPGNTAGALNDWTQIVGVAGTASGVGHAVVWHC